MTVFLFQEASRVLLSNACRPVVTDGITMFLDVLLDMLFRPVPQPLGNINLSRDTGNGRKTSDKTLSPYAKRLKMVALVLAVVCIARDGYRPNGERVDRCTSSLQTSATGHWEWRSSLRLRQWPLGIDGPGCQAPQSGWICHWTTLCRSYGETQ